MHGVAAQPANSNSEITSLAFNSMGCPCEIHLHSSDLDGAMRAAVAARDEVDRLDLKYSHYLADNFLARMQRNASRPEGIKVDEETAGLLNYADQQHHLTGGLFDITAKYLTALWDQPKALPNEGEIAAARFRTGWTRVEWHDPCLRMPEGTALDFGAIVKEYAADRAALMLKQRGHGSACVNLGGDLHVLGPHPDGSPWQVGICNPQAPSSAVAGIPVHLGGLATSGDYERFSVFDGVRYGHIVNPLTGWPLGHNPGDSPSRPWNGSHGFSSVSVLAPTCLLAGSLATSALLFGLTKGLPFLADCGLPWMAVLHDGRVRSHRDFCHAP